MNKKKTATLIALVSIVGLFLAPGTAFAVGPSGQASCMGIEAAAISPPGSSEEIPGGMPGLKEFVDSIPVPPGVVYSTIAKLHEGSHEACDEALE